MSNDPWDGILEDGEKIVWQGRPAATFANSLGSWQSLVVLPFIGWFIVPSLFDAITSRHSFGILPIIFMLAFGSIFAWIVWDNLFGTLIRRRSTFYTLTDRRAIIATRLPLRKRTLSSYPITAKTAITLEDGPLSTLNFAQEVQGSGEDSRTVPVGFELIPDAREVKRLMRGIQNTKIEDAAAKDRQDKTDRPAL